MKKYLAAIILFALILPINAWPETDKEKDNLVPITYLLQPTTSFRFRLSPDGNHLASVKRIQNMYYLLITNLDTYQIVQNLYLGKYSASNLLWVNNDLLSYNIDGRITVINSDGTENRTILDNFGNPKENQKKFSLSDIRLSRVINRLKNNREEVLVESLHPKGYSTIQKLNIYTGELTEIANGSKKQITDWIVDRDGHVRLAVKEKKGSIKYFIWDEHKKKLKPIGKKEKGGYPLDFNGKTFAKRSIVFEYIDYEQDCFYLSIRSEGDRFKLWKYRINDFSPIEKIWSDDRYDVGGAQSVIEMHWHDPDRKLAGISYHAQEYKTVWFDDRFKKIQDKINKNYPSKINKIFAWTDDLSKFLIHQSWPESKGKIYIYDKKKAKMALYAELSPGISGYGLGELSPIRYKADDGYEIEGYITLPPSNKKTFPLVVMPHGGPWIRDYAEFDPYVQYFSTRGYAVLQVNFRGSIGYGYTHLSAGMKEYSGLMLSDIHDGAQWAIRSGLADKNNIFIMGTSYGGYAALMSAIKYPGFYKGAVSLAAPLDIQQEIKDRLKDDNYFAYDFWNTAIGNVKMEKKILQNMSPFYRIKELNVPVQIFHGVNDDNIKVDSVYKFKKLANKYKKDNIKIRIIQDEGHGFSNQSNEIYYLESALEHFKKYTSVSN